MNFFFTPEFLPVLNLKFHFIIHFLDNNYFCEGEEVMNAFLLNLLIITIPTSCSSSL